MKQITVGGIEIALVRKDIRNMHLGVYPPAGRVRLAVPLGVDDERARLFAISRLAWIRKAQRSFQQQPRVPAREYVSGESHYVNGRRYRLNVVLTDAPPRVALRHQHIDLHVRPDADAPRRAAVLNAWYRARLKAAAAPILARWKARLSLGDVTLSIRQMRTRWGSCSVDTRRIWLNLELAKRSAEALEFIIVHELMHFFERHHNERFFALLTQHLPEWRRIREELKELPLEDGVD